MHTSSGQNMPTMAQSGGTLDLSKPFTWAEETSLISLEALQMKSSCSTSSATERIYGSVRVHRVLPKDRTPRTTASHKQITYQYTNVCHVVKTLERETVHGPGQMATSEQFIMQKKESYMSFS